MRFWNVFYLSGLIYVFKVGKITNFGKIFLFSFFFIPNYIHYKKKFVFQKKKIYDSLIQLSVNNLKKPSNEVIIQQFMNEFEFFLNKKL